MVEALSAQGAINQGQTNSLLKKLMQAQSAIGQGKPEVAYDVIEAFHNEVQSLIASGVLTDAQGDPLLTVADLLLQSLLTGGGF